MSQSESASARPAPITAEQLKTFLNETPLMYSPKLHSQAEKHILTNCYRALWNNNTEWMQTYFFSEEYPSNDNLMFMLEKYNLFGSKKDASDMNQGNLHNSNESEPEYMETQRGKQCGHVFKRGESIYRCRNCGLDDTCVMCSKCFHGTSHEGHDIKIAISKGTGGCCDCGDPEAWKVPLRCKIHYLDSSENQLPNASTESLSSIPTPLLTSVRQTVTVVADYILETFAASPENVATLGTVKSIEKDCVDSHTAFGLPIDLSTQSYACVLWNDEVHSFDQVISIVQRAIKCTPDHADLIAQSIDRHGRRVIKESTDIESLIQAGKIIGTVGLAVSVSSVHKVVREETAGLLLDWLKGLISGKYKFFNGVDGGNCVIRDIICEVFSADWSLSPALARLSERTGVIAPATQQRDRFYASDNEMDEDFPPLVDMGNEDIDQGEDIDEGEDMDESEAMDEGDAEGTEGAAENNVALNGTEPVHTRNIMDFVVDVDNSGSVTVNLVEPDIHSFDWNWNSWLERVDQLESSERQISRNLNVYDNNVASHSKEHRENVLSQFSRKIRLDYLLRFDLRLWKSARMNVKDLLIGTFISNFQYRPIMGLRFVRNYPELVDSYFFKDREPENSTNTLSVQILTVPTVASILVKEYKFFEVICTVLANFFLTDSIRMSLPEGYAQTQIQVGSNLASRQRYAYTIHDLHYLMNAEPVKLEICQNPLYLGQFLNMLYQFQGMDPNKHHSITHVEYETNSWVIAFNISIQISKLCDQFSSCYSAYKSHITKKEASGHLCRAIGRVLKAINDWRAALPPTADQSKPLVKGTSQLTVKQVSAPGVDPVGIVDYSITLNPVSLHHPFHWLLSELFQQIDLLDEDTLKENGWSNGFREMVNWVFKSNAKGSFMHILESPIQTVAFLSQINCGAWVRNGYSVRNQAYTYKDITVRENALDQDINLLQVGFSVCDSNQLLLTLIDRFELLDWFKGKPLKNIPAYDSVQTLFMVEELLNLLIICATEHDYVSGTTIDQRVRKFIIQNLGITNLPHSELMKNTPGSLCEYEFFENELNNVARFRAPGGVDDKGMYEIKSECLDEMDPYFWYYTRNEREEAMAKLKKRWNEKNPDNTLGESDEFFMEPKVRRIEKGPYQHLGNFLHSKIFVQIFVYSLWNFRMFKEARSETVLDETIYLGMLAVKDPNHSEASFFKNVTQEKYAVQVNEIEKSHYTLLTVILHCVEEDRFSNARKRLGYIIDKIEESGTQEAKEVIGAWKIKTQHGSLAEKNTKASNELSEKERKKAAAKARQAAIMSQFANAQSKFLETHADMYKSDDEIKDTEEEMMTFDSANRADAESETDIVRKCYFPTDNCIVCQEALDDDKLYGMLGLVQYSRIQRATPDSKEVWAEILESANYPDNPWETRDTSYQEIFNGFECSANLSGVDISSCGHLVHSECFEAYQKSVHQDNLTRRLSLRQPETRFMCPLCKAVGNVLVPIVWKGKKERFPGVMAPSTPYEEFNKNLQTLATNVHWTLHTETNKIPASEQDFHLSAYDREKLQFLYNKLMKAIHKSRGNSPNVNTIDLKNSLIQLYDMYAYTIGNREIAQRGSKNTRVKDLMVEHTGTFIDDVSKTSQVILKILALTNTLVSRLMDTPWQTDEPRVREVILKQDLNKIVPQTPNRIPLLMDNPFNVLVHLGFSTEDHPSIEPYHLMRVLYIAEVAVAVIGIAQAILRNKELLKDPLLSQSLESLRHGQTENSQFEGFIDCVLKTIGFSEIEKVRNQLGNEGFAALVRLYTLPYLRKSLLLMVVHHGFIPQAPSDTSMVGETPVCEYDELLEILRLPRFDSVFDLNDSEKTLLTGWLEDFKCHDSMQISLRLPTKYRLVNLPYRLDHLIDESVKRVCENCGTVPEHSAICLICGTFVCTRQMCCFQENKGECNTHMKRCGGDVGLYMVVKDCYLALLHDSGGSIMNAPYLDNHGEADIFLKRGSPQFLNDKRYEQLRQMWLSHTVPLFIRRRMELTQSETDWETF